MTALDHYAIAISVDVTFVEEESDVTHDQYVFRYEICIENQSEVAIQLIARKWMITDGLGNLEEVQGLGVVGQQPVIQPNMGFSYVSSARLSTPIGYMEGAYQMLADNGQAFDALIERFDLVMPRVLH